MTTRTKEYILTESGNHISRTGLNLINTQSIVLGGKTILESHVTIRGDHCRPNGPSAVSMGRYCRVSRHASLLPPHRTHHDRSDEKDKEEDGVKKWYPLKMGDYVHVGAHSSVSAASIASYVYIGDHCVVGNMCIIKEGSVIEDGTVLPPYSVVAPFTRVAGDPGLAVGECPEVMVEVLRDRAREHYAEVLAGS